MNEPLDKRKLTTEVARLALANPTDAVRLAFLSPEGDLSALDGLDLSLVAEVKVGDRSGAQVKLVDKVALLKLLSELVESGEADGSNQAGSFFQALNAAAEKLYAPPEPAPAEEGEQ